MPNPPVKGGMDGQWCVIDIRSWRRVKRIDEERSWVVSLAIRCVCGCVVTYQW